MRTSLCLLHINEIYPEIFGYSHIEANLLGTPVLCCDNGSNKEILVNSHDQITSCKDPYLLKNKIMKLQKKAFTDIKRSNEYSKQNAVSLWNSVLWM